MPEEEKTWSYIACWMSKKPDGGTRYTNSTAEEIVVASKMALYRDAQDWMVKHWKLKDRLDLVCLFFDAWEE